MIDGVETRFKELIRQICAASDLEILAMECHIDHCHLFVNAPPKLSPADIMKSIKGGAAPVLRREFEALSRTKQLWTRSYFVSTAGKVSNDTIKRYVETQKTSGR